jgi:CBS domain containing-hemolysin-like protein
MTGPAGWLVFVVLLAANALFVSAEFSLTSVDRTRLTRVAGAGSRRAQSTLAAVRELAIQLSGAQFGITIASLLVGFVAEPLFSSVIEPLTSPSHCSTAPPTRSSGWPAPSRSRSSAPHAPPSSSRR